MISKGKSLVCLVLIPGVVAGNALGYANSNWDLPWWAMLFVALGGWLIGFALAVIVGETLLKRWE